LRSVWVKSWKSLSNRIIINIPLLLFSKMKYETILIIALWIGSGAAVLGQHEVYSFRADLTVAEEMQTYFNPDGRLFLFLCQNPWVEPRTQTWPGPWSKCQIFACNVSGMDPSETMRIDGAAEWISTADWTLDRIPEGEYYVQVLWDQDLAESGINAPGNLYSEKQRIRIDQSVELDIELDRRIGVRIVEEHPLVREVDMVSDTLSAWWGRPMHLKASLLLPANYEEGSHAAYPIRYNVAGYGGRYTRVNYLVRDKEFMNWWHSDDAPGIINVFLDGEGPFGDSYQMDSENSGPYGYALIHELIPHIESRYRGTDSPETRFVDGCSTGGWVSLALQVFYPDHFNGAFSYSPDAIDFENYQLINIYEDENTFINEYGYPRPIMRDIDGEPLVSWKDFVRVENVLGASNTYLNSGGQICSHTALYSPRGKDGLPQPLIDPVTGKIDHEVARHWRKYDLKAYCREHWEELGPKLQGKLFIWMGDMDQFYLNTATRAFEDFIDRTETPRSDAEIIFSPMEGHCSKFSHREVLLKIRDRIANIRGQ